MSVSSPIGAAVAVVAVCCVGEPPFVTNSATDSMHLSSEEQESYVAFKAARYAWGTVRVAELPGDIVEGASVEMASCAGPTRPGYSEAARRRGRER